MMRLSVVLRNLVLFAAIGVGSLALSGCDSSQSPAARTVAITPPPMIVVPADDAPSAPPTRPVTAPQPTPTMPSPGVGR